MRPKASWLVTCFPFFRDLWTLGKSPANMSPSSTAAHTLPHSPRWKMAQASEGRSTSDSVVQTMLPPGTLMVSRKGSGICSSSFQGVALICFKLLITRSGPLPKGRKAGPWCGRA